jgi:hypothetical protein
VSRKIGRNDPCPCGSGKKHKKCCLGRVRPAPSQLLTPSRSPMASPVEEGRFRIEPGSYAVGAGLHAPAIAGFKRTDDGEWEYYFVLVNPDEGVLGREHAQMTAARHLREAVEEKTRGGSDVEMALALRSAGYVKVEDFLVAESEDDEGFTLYQTGYDEGLGYNPRARAALLGIVDKQLRANDPPEARQAFERMIREGLSEKEAKVRIGALVAGEIFGIVRGRRKFDDEGYVEALKRLPELPENLIDGGLAD